MKNKKTIAIGLVIVILCIIGVYQYVDNNYIMPFTAKEEIILEYGEKIPTTLETYIEVTDKEKFNKKDITLDNKTDNMKVGTYDCHIKWRKAEAIAKVTVKDTKKPVITLKNKTVNIKYAEEYSLKDNVKKAYDVIDGNLDVKIKGKLNNEKSGKQNFTVIATDKNGNETKKEFVVKVGKKPAWPKTYKDSTSTITIYKEWFRNAWVYAAHIQFKDYDRLKSTTASGGYETTSSAASRLDAILTINGDYNADSSGGIVRNGEVIRDYGYCDAAGVYNQNTGIFKYGLDLGGSLTSLVNSGKITDTMSFCNSSVYIHNGVLSGNRWGNSRAQRTFMGTNGNAGDIWLCVSDGRYNDGESAGLTYLECGEYLQTKGCTFAVPLDGGGSSTMVFKGEVLNAERGHERAVVDFVYFD